MKQHSRPTTPSDQARTSIPVRRAMMSKLGDEQSPDGEELT
jgi:hypothetical protein